MNSENSENIDNTRNRCLLGESTSNMLSFGDGVMELEHTQIHVSPRENEQRVQRSRRHSQHNKFDTTFRPQNPSAPKVRMKRTSKSPPSKNSMQPTSHSSSSPASREQAYMSEPFPCVEQQLQQEQTAGQYQHPHPHQHRQQHYWERSFMEVFPGKIVPMVGIQETLSAFEADDCQHATCLQCDTFLYCSQSASMVLCSSCKSISPVQKKRGGSYATTPDILLLGIGLTYELVLESWRD